MEKNTRVKWQSAKGVCRFPWLHPTPDTHFSDDGEFKTQLVVQPEDARDLIAKINDFANSKFDAGDLTKAHFPFSTDQETGEIIFKAKSKYAPAFYDTQGEVVESPPSIYSGSLIRMGGEMVDYRVSKVNFGVTLYLGKVQIIKAVSSKSGDGFDAIEGEEINLDDLGVPPNEDNEERASRF